MKHRYPLYLKILLWLGLNLLLLGVMAAGLLAGHFGLDLLVAGRAGDRLRGIRDVIRAELQSQPVAEWDAVLQRQSTIHGVNLLLFQEDGVQLAGQATVLPMLVRAKLAEGSGERHGPDRPEPGPDRRGFDEGHDTSRPERPGRGKGDFDEHEHGFDKNGFRRKSGHGPESMPLSQPRFVLHTSSPTRYWVGLLSFLPAPAGQSRLRSLLIVESDSIHGHGLFFDTTPILIVGGAALMVSVLFWFPLVRRITQALGEMTVATKGIAEGRFDGRVQVRRRDELGQLGDAVNSMAERLEGFVGGQKRFLGDIAHELCSPIARIQMAVGILEQRADALTQPYVQDVREELQQMSDLVAELLSFSKASLAGAQVKLIPVKIPEIIRQAVRRENQPESQFRVEVDGEPEALANPELLQRALGNLLRNAIRYAGGNGAITIAARREADDVWLTVSDCGPGVSEESLQRLFDPFFRVDDARTRESGGVGLGLTIVKTCVEACRGTVTCRNLKPSGLEVAIRLRAV